MFARRLQDLGIGHHDAEVDDLEVVALEHDADDVLADVVHVALDRGGNDGSRALGLSAFAFLVLHEGYQVGHRLLHDAGAFHHLGQEHLARAEQVADHVHAVHEGPFDDLDGTVGAQARLFRVLDDVFGDALDQRVAQAFADRGLAPAQVLGFGARLSLGRPRDLHQALGGVGAPVQHHVLDPFAQIVGDVGVDRQLAGIDDAHVHPGLDRVVQEHRVHGLAYRVVAAERERHVADAAAGQRVGQGFFYLAHRFDVIDGEVVVFLDAGGDGKDVGIEDDVLGRHADLFGQDFVGPGTDIEHARLAVRLAVLVEGHDDHRGAVAQDLPGMGDEGLLALLEADRVHHRLALDALEAGLDHRPLG